MKNFAILKESIYDEILNLLKENRSRAKQLIKGYLNILKQYPTLKEVFHIHNNFDSGYFQNDDVKHGFIIENLNAIKRLNKEELHLGLKALDKFIRLNQIKYTTDLNILSEKISNLMLNVHKVDKSVDNNQAIEYIIESVLKRKPNNTSRKPVNHRIFKEVAMKNYHEKYGNLNATEKKIIKNFFNGDQKAIKEQYELILSEVKTIINSKIVTTEDKDTKLKLYEVKDKLIDVPKEITLEHFKKILQLQENLT